MTAQQELYDTTIIGGGPAGLYAAFYTGMRDMKTKIIEAQHQLGGKLLRYPKKMIWDVGGVTPIRAEHLVAQLIEQAMTFEPSVVLGQTITGLERLADGTYMLTAESGERHYTKTIIMGIGYGILKLAKLEIEGADRYEAANLHYSVQQLDIFRDKRVLISGGGDSAVDWANELEPLAASVTVVHRRDQFGGLERNVIRMMESSVDVRTPYAIESLHSEDGKAIRRVVVQQLETGATETLDVDAVIVNHGYKSDFGPLREWGLDIGDWDVTVGPGMETAQPGIFAAGDFVTYDNKVKLIAGTFTDAVLAVNSAKVYVEPGANRFGYVSSHNDKFKEKNRALGVEV